MQKVNVSKATSSLEQKLFPKQTDSEIKTITSNAVIRDVSSGKVESVAEVKAQRESGVQTAVKSQTDLIKELENKIINGEDSPPAEDSVNELATDITHVENVRYVLSRECQKVGT